jgi:ADP-ribose pyrophosphatase YjhB (NUDIX family)
VEAALRETREEIGVEALKMHRVFCHPCLAGREVVTFQVAEYEGTPRPMEGAAVDWVYPAVLLKPHCSFREYNTALFRHLGILVTLDEFRLAYLDYVEGVQPEPKFESLSVSDQDRASRWIRSLAAVCGVDPTAQRPSTEDLLAKSDRDR